MRSEVTLKCKRPFGILGMKQGSTKTSRCLPTIAWKSRRAEVQQRSHTFVHNAWASTVLPGQLSTTCVLPERNGRRIGIMGPSR